MTKTLTGIVHGNTIELLSDAGLAEGATVEIQVRIIPNPTESQSDTEDGEKSLLDDWSEEDDRILAEIEQARRSTRRRDLP